MQGGKFLVFVYSPMVAKHFGEGENITKKVGWGTDAESFITFSIIASFYFICNGYV